jgi:DNA-binding protein H-NS
MKRQYLNSMSVDQLWSLHERITTELARKISDEKAQLDERLRLLRAEDVSQARRPYPQVLPKYRNPAKPSETWAGRGRQPRWVTAELKSGKKLDDFRIQPPSARARHIAGQ